MRIARFSLANSSQIVGLLALCCICVIILCITFSTNTSYSKRGEATFAKGRLTLIANLLDHYKKEHNGKLPIDLDELASFAGPDWIDVCACYRFPTARDAHPWTYFRSASNTRPEILIATSRPIVSETFGICRAVLLTNLKISIMRESDFIINIEANNVNSVRR